MRGEKELEKALPAVFIAGLLRKQGVTRLLAPFHDVAQRFDVPARVVDLLPKIVADGLKESEFVRSREARSIPVVDLDAEEHANNDDQRSMTIAPHPCLRKCSTTRRRIM